ncbi:MAG TPA: zinc ribbon domain-containing protein [Thermoleophilaceae bacterium]|jgi:putative FmdB family regulatory protein
MIWPVPIYDFHCEACGTTFEELVRGDSAPPCPSCGAAEPRRLISQVSPPARVGLRGAAAKRSDSLRKAREERKREQRAARRESDRGG